MLLPMLLNFHSWIVDHALRRYLLTLLHPGVLDEVTSLCTKHPLIVSEHSMAYTYKGIVMSLEYIPH